MFRDGVMAHGYAEFRFCDVVQRDVVLICDVLPLVFVLSDDAASTKCERGAGGFRVTDDFIWCSWGALSAYAIIHCACDTSMQREYVLRGEVVAESGQRGCGAFVECPLVALNAFGVFSGQG